MVETNIKIFITYILILSFTLFVAWTLFDKRWKDNPVFIAMFNCVLSVIQLVCIFT